MRITKRVKRVLRFLLIILIPDLRWYLQFQKANKKARTRSSFKNTLWAFRKGFYLETINVCKIAKNNYRDFLSDRTYKKLHPINKSYSSIIDNKLYLPYLLKDFDELVPEYYFLVRKGELYPISNNSGYDNLGYLLRDKEKLVIKPCASSLGIGFNLLEFKEGLFHLNKQPIAEKEIEKFVGTLDNYIVTQFVEQHEYSANINSGSTNTVRLLLVRDNEIMNSYNIPVSFHRFGIGNKLVDNLTAGEGLLVFIDPLKGMLKNTGMTKKRQVELTSIGTHPVTKQQISGLRIPNWDFVVKKVFEVMDQISFIEYTGIDIVITSDGLKVLEMNSLPTLSAIQCEQGVYKNFHLSKFFQMV